MTLAANDLLVRFGGVLAIDGVTLEVEPGLVSGVVGPNGAGKTTVFNCITGFVTPDKGSVVMDGDDLSGLAPHLRARRGLSRGFQRPRVDLEDRVLDAVALGLSARHRPSLVAALLGLPAVRRRERTTREASLAALERVGLADHAHRQVSELSLGQLRLLEVARSTVSDPRYLLLDEPAAGLGPDDRKRLQAALRDVCDGGTGVLLIEHNLEFVAAVSDHVAVLHQGRVIFTGTPVEFRSSPEVRAAYIGRAPDEPGSSS